ncbi:hypothetical protein TNCT_517481 [Trichonephila clavata]|uniref:HTH psq-type domain-containing protein n=1 Tax=Trichonephila clavata TaxID=2740835 RepID=A0A8X6LZH8_TRICU|nr:hypothetical protein TNCT_517481 [Trichonephila clavata]
MFTNWQEEKKTGSASVEEAGSSDRPFSARDGNHLDRRRIVPPFHFFISSADPAFVNRVRVFSGIFPQHGGGARAREKSRLLTGGGCCYGGGDTLLLHSARRSVAAILGGRGSLRTEGGEDARDVNPSQAHYVSPTITQSSASIVDGHLNVLCLEKSKRSCICVFSTSSVQHHKMMPRNSDRIKKSKHNADNITAAAEAVLKDGVPVRTAVRQFGVSRTTLQRHIAFCKKTNNSENMELNSAYYN